MIRAALIALAVAGEGSLPPARDAAREPASASDDQHQHQPVDAAAGPRAGAPCHDHAAGTHLRMVTPQGPVHLFRPPGYDRRTAGLIVYVHGLYVNVDQAWQEHHLAEQFAASGQNALFIAPEAPVAAEDEPQWRSLESLIVTALRRAHWPRPAGPVIAVGHSGAYRTLLLWLSEPVLRHLILVDAMYGNEADFRDWLTGGRARKMTLVVKGTARWADPFVRSFRAAITRAEIPASYDALSRGERRAKLLCFRSQYGHMELVTEGRALPILLQRAGLRPVVASPAISPPSGAASTKAKE